MMWVDCWMFCTIKQIIAHFPSKCNALDKTKKKQTIKEPIVSYKILALTLTHTFNTNIQIISLSKYVVCPIISKSIHYSFHPISCLVCVFKQRSARKMQTIYRVQTTSNDILSNKKHRTTFGSIWSPHAIEHILHMQWASTQNP